MDSHITMNPNELRDNVLRSEGYAEGFKAGYASCAKFMAIELSKEQKEKEEKIKEEDKNGA